MQSTGSVRGSHDWLTIMVSGADSSCRACKLALASVLVARSLRVVLASASQASPRAAATSIIVVDSMMCCEVLVYLVI